MDVDSTWAALALLAAALLLNLIVAAADGALATISRSTLRLQQEKERSGSDTALLLLDDLSALQTTIGLLRLLFGVLITIATLWLLEDIQRNWVLAAAFGLALLLVTVPTTLARAAGVRWYKRLAPALAPAMRALLLGVAPLRLLLEWAHQRVAGMPEEEEEATRLNEEEWRVLLSVVGGEEESELADQGREMIHSIVSLSQTTVREVMVPRPDLVALRATATMHEALDTVIKAGHSRIPVYEENIDNIIGVLYAKDLLGYLRDGRTNAPIRDMLRPALFVPTSKRADELLQDLQGRRVHLAVVFDEYGGTAGLVTIEDILEEIVGEIRDEYDAEEEAYHPISEYEAMVSGRLDIDDLNYEMGLALPTDENDTVGGLIYSALGRVPLLHDEVRMEEAGLTFRVVNMSGRRIQKVRVLVDQPASAEDGGEGLPATSDTPTISRGGPNLDPSRLMFW